MNSDSQPPPLVRPSRRRRYLKWFGVAVLIVVVLGVAALLSVDYLARRAIESAGTRALGVVTTLDKLSLGIFSANSSLSGFQVANPAGFKSSYFLRLDRGALDMSLSNVLSEPIEIEQLSLSGIHLNLVRETDQANFRTIIANIQRFEQEMAKAGSDQVARKKFIIHSVVIRDVHVKIDLLPIGGKLTELDVPIDVIELKDVGTASSQGQNLARVIATIVRALLEAVLAKGEGLLPPDMLEDLKGKLSELKPLETLRALRGKLEERREQRPQRVEPREPRDGVFGPLRQRRQEKRQQRSGSGVEL